MRRIKKTKKRKERNEPLRDVYGETDPQQTLGRSRNGQQSRRKTPGKQNTVARKNGVTGNGSITGRKRI
jgi:hypothetical protein